MRSNCYFPFGLEGSIAFSKCIKRNKWLCIDINGLKYEIYYIAGCATSARF